MPLVQDDIQLRCKPQRVGEDLAALEETLHILSNPHAKTDLTEAREALATGDFVDGIDTIQRLRPGS